MRGQRGKKIKKKKKKRKEKSGETLAHTYLCDVCGIHLNIGSKPQHEQGLCLVHVVDIGESLHSYRDDTLTKAAAFLVPD